MSSAADAPVGSKAPSLRRNFGFTLASNLIFAASQWLVISAIARLGSPEAVGHYALGLAIATPVLMLLNLSLRSFQIADRGNRYTFDHYLRLRLSTSAVAAVAIIGIALLHRSRDAAAAAVILVGLAKVAESISDIAYGAFQQREAMHFVTTSIILRSIVSVAAAVGAMWMTGSVALVALATVVGWGACAAFDVWRARTITQSGSSQEVAASSLLRLTRESLPLAVAAAVLTFNGNVPRFAVDHFLGAAALGVFAAVSYVFIPMTTLANALGQAVAPRLALHAEREEWSEFRSLLLRVIAFGSAIGVGGAVAVAFAGRPLLRLLYGAEYQDQTRLLGVVMLAGAVATVATFLGYASNALRDYDRFVTPYVALAVAGTFVAYWLTASQGVIGAAWAFVFFTTGNLVVALWLVSSGLHRVKARTVGVSR